MRRLLCLFFVVALALLPMGGMVRSALAADRAAASDCHHAAAMTAHGHSHHAQHLDSALARETATVSMAGVHAAVVGSPAQAPCPYCGPNCHCILVCGIAVSLAPDGAVIAPVTLDDRIIRPSLSVALKSIATRPWPPPPRA